MTINNWLEANAPGFNDLTPGEREAISHFSLLWGLFENEAMGGQGNVPSIQAIVDRWAAIGMLNAHIFADELAYFRGRYFSNGEFTHRFDHLHLEKSGNPQVVRDVLSGQTNDTHACVVAVLIIVYRYRNNLLHGEKWVYALREQDQNFAHANAIVMRAIEMDRSARQSALGR